jgi:glycosyltransferase involved in cell wall biosynthesis
MQLEQSDGAAVSLVVPIRNETDSLAMLVESIRGQTRLPDEVILVDGGSTDATVALARRLTADDPRFRIIESGPATPGRGRNVGIAAATHEWIALTDAGIRLEPDWLERLLERAQREPSLDVVYGNFEPLGHTFFQRCAALAYCPARQPREEGRSRGPSTASMLLRRSVCERVGGFPDRRAAEDLIFFERTAAAGCSIGWAPKATVWWQLQPNLSRTFKRFCLYSKHNVWAGRQRHWHYGIARQYLLALPLLVLALVHNPWWLILLAAGALARIAKTIWQKREGRSLWSLLNPLQFLGVGLILAAIDLATFVGWAQAIFQRPESRPRLAAEHAQADQPC